MYISTTISLSHALTPVSLKKRLQGSVEVRLHEEQSKARDQTYKNVHFCTCVVGHLDKSADDDVTIAKVC